MINTRTIGYIDPNEDILDQEVELALNKSMDENLIDYCQLIRRLYAMSDIDIINYSSEKTIYFIEDSD